MLKSNCKHVPADGVMHMQDKCKTHNLLLIGELTGKNATGTTKVFKQDQLTNLKMPGYPYFSCYEVEVAGLFNTSLVSSCKQKLFRLYFS